MTPDVLALTWAMIFPSVMTWIYFVWAAGPGTQPNKAVMAAYLVGKIVQFAFPAVYVALTDSSSLNPTWPSWQGSELGLAFGVIVAVLALLLYFGLLKNTQLVKDTPAKILAKLRESHCDSLAGYLALASFIVIFHSLLEEYYWRWFVFGWLQPHMATWLAVLLASLGFMAHHVIVLAVYFPGVRGFFTMALPMSLGVAIGGAVWCLIYQRTGSLYSAWISHALIDAAVMGIGFDMVRGKF